MKLNVKKITNTLVQTKTLLSAVAYFILLFGTIVNAVIWYRTLPITQNVQAIEYKVLANEEAIMDIGKDIDYLVGRVDQIYNLMIK